MFVFGFHLQVHLAAVVLACKILLVAVHALLPK